MQEPQPVQVPPVQQYTPEQLAEMQQQQAQAAQFTQPPQKKTRRIRGSNSKMMSSLQDLFASSKTKFIGGTLILALFFYMMFSSIFSAPSTLTVIGKDTVSFDADTVSMVVTVVSGGTTASGAIDAGEKDVSSLISIAKTAVGGETEVKKAFYQVQPTITSRGSGYQVANVFSLSFADVSKTNDVVKNLYDSGATTVNNVAFSVKDETSVSQEARKAAVDDAKVQAKSIAKASGKRLGKILSISDDNQGTSGSVASESSEGTDFSNVTITKVVSVVYELK